MDEKQKRSASSSLSSSTRSGIGTTVPGLSDLKATLLASLEISKEVKRLHAGLEAKIEEHEARAVLQEARIKALEKQVAKVDAIEQETIALRNGLSDFASLSKAVEDLQATLESMRARSAETASENPIKAKPNGINGHAYSSEEDQVAPPMLERPQSRNSRGMVSPADTAPSVHPPVLHGLNGHQSGLSSTAMSPSSSLSSSTSKRVSFAEASYMPKINGKNDMSSSFRANLSNDTKQVKTEADDGGFNSDGWKPLPADRRPSRQAKDGANGRANVHDAKNDTNGASSSSDTFPELQGLDIFVKQLDKRVDYAKPADFPEHSAAAGTSKSGSTSHKGNGSLSSSYNTTPQSMLLGDMQEELEELREFKSAAMSREEALKTELKLLRTRKTSSTSGGKAEELDEREEKLSETQTLLMDQHKRQIAQEKALADREARLGRAEKLCQDHTDELEKRLKLVQKREARQDQEEGISEMRRREPSFSARDAAQFRKEQTLNFKAKDLDRRAEELNRAEQEWCRKTGAPYVPVFKA